MADLINVAVRSVGAVLWAIVLLRSLRDDDDEILANRPRRRMIYFVVAAYASMLVVGGIYGAGYLQFVPVPALYATVSAASALGAISILTSPDTIAPTDETIATADERRDGT